MKQYTSGISGEEWLYAKLLNSDGEVVLTDSLKMTIKVPNLISLESVSNDYVFYGGRQQFSSSYRSSLWNLFCLRKNKK